MACIAVKVRPRTKREALRESVEWLRSEGRVMDAQRMALGEAKRDRSGLPSDDLDKPDPLSGTTIFFCGKGLRIEVCPCGYEASHLCDWPTGTGTTCDLPLCEDCRREAGPGRDFCPTHAGKFDESSAEEE